MDGPERARRDYPRARKRFGQHFLEPAWVVRLVDAIGPSATETFLEIGPGRGALTRELAPRVGSLVCVEIDRDLAARLETSVPSNVRVITADILETDILSIVAAAGPPADATVRVVGNLPYNVASPILFKLLESSQDGRLADATVMLQKEVADRLAAEPGSDAYGAMAIQAAYRADTRIVFTLPPGAFRPPPKVTSAVVHLRFRSPHVDVGREEVFTRLVRGAFLQRRKTILNALDPVARAMGHSAAELIERTGVDPRRRPEQLTLADFARLSRAVL